MRSWRLFALICLVIALASSSLSYYLWVQNAALHRSLLEAQTKMQEYQRTLEDLQAKINIYENALEHYKRIAKEYSSMINKVQPERNLREAEIEEVKRSIYVPAVREVVVGSWPFLQTEYEGVLMKLSVEVRPGEGRVLVETTPKMGTIFQDAANIAVYVAERYTGFDLSNYDVIFSVEAPKEVSEVDGPSAGAAMTAILIAALEGKNVRNDTTLTGTINPDGSVGAVGGIYYKALAARRGGLRRILIPLENSRLITYREVKREIAPGFVLIERTPELVDAKEYLEKEIGIDVEYVDSIEDVVRELLI